MALLSGRSKTIDSSEKLSRFFEKRKNKPYANLNGILVAKPAFLIPDNHTETSVSRVDDLSNDEIIAIGDDVCRKKQENQSARTGESIIESRCSSLGRVEFLAGDCRNAALEVEADEGPLHHANIINWAGCMGKKKLETYASLKLQRKRQAIKVFEKHAIIMHRDVNDKCFS